MTRTLKDHGQQCWGVYEGEHLVARIVPHGSGFGWRAVDLAGNALTTQPYASPELFLQYLPVDF